MNVYDDKVSSTVSLSKILDCYIIDKEPASVVCQFLKKYDEHFKDILDNSLVSERIYQLDYLRDCSSSESYYLLNHLEDIDDSIAATCIWQLMRCPDLLLKSEASKHVKTCIANKQYLHHPYSGISGKSMQAFDQYFFDGYCPETFLSTIAYDDFMVLLKFINCSLFASRIYQYDVFENCTYAYKYILIKSIRSLHPRILCNFAKQVLMSNEVPEIKYEILNKIYEQIDWLDSVYFDKFIETETCKTLKSCKTYPEVAIYMQLCGDIVSHDVIFYMLTHNMIRILYEFLEMDEETLQKNFPIKDLLMHIKNKFGKCFNDTILISEVADAKKEANKSSK